MRLFVLTSRSINLSASLLLQALSKPISVFLTHMLDVLSDTPLLLAPDILERTFSSLIFLGTRELCTMARLFLRLLLTSSQLRQELTMPGDDGTTNLQSPAIRFYRSDGT